MLVLIIAMIVIGAIIVAPIVFNTIGLGPVVETLLRILRWPILFGVALIVLAIIYRYGPSRTPARWRWVSWARPARRPSGRSAPSRSRSTSRTSAAANETYGSLGAVVILLMWFWLSAFIVLLGAELNSEMEHQTERNFNHRPRHGPSAAAAPTSPTTSARCPDRAHSARFSSASREGARRPRRPLR